MRKNLNFPEKLIVNNRMLKLDSNEFPFKHAPSVSDCLQSQFDFVSCYPESTCLELRNELAKINNIDPENILITAGSSEAIHLAVSELTDSSSEIITSTHAFELYQTCIQRQNKHLIAVPETELWMQNLVEILNSITSKTSLIFIASPSNPLGTWINHGDLSNFLQAVPDYITVAIDEAYFEFMDNEPAYCSAVSYLNKYPNIIIMRTFSKLYGLAGARIGYTIANRELIKRLKQGQLLFSVNYFAMVCALKVLGEYDYYQRCKNRIIQVRTLLYEQLSYLGFHPLSNSSNFLTFKYGSKSEMLVKELRNRGILIKWLNNYRLPEYLRVTIGTLDEVQAFFKNFIEINNILLGAIGKVTLADTTFNTGIDER